MTHEDHIVGDDCADTEVDGYGNMMGDDSVNPNVNPLASNPELRKEDNVPMSNPVSRVVNSTIPPSSKTSLVAIDGNVYIEVGAMRVCSHTKHDKWYESKFSKYYKSEYLMTAYSELIHRAGDQSDWITPEDVRCKVVWSMDDHASEGHPPLLVKRLSVISVLSAKVRHALF
ncbi:hypothetical protein QYF36_015772 [Acer negundo]|nr:hypothetical protein QYF36_015772 [Acer negundo]